MPKLTRRDLFRTAPLAAVPLLLGEIHAAEPASGLITRMQEPRNLETPLASLVKPGNDTLLTETESFYVRSHFSVPAIDAKTWKLRVEGDVENPLELSLEDLKRLEFTQRALTLECAGNGRVFLSPQVRGLQWGFGGVGTALWGGVKLSAVLDKARLKKSAAEVILVGADAGPVNSDPPSPGPIPFDRSLPLDKAMKPEVLLATEMNQEPLTPAHGFPLRAVVGGWYGMASVKWLTRIIVTSQPYQGFWQTLDYSHFERRSGLPSLVPLTRMQPKAIITSHGSGQVIRAGVATALTGLAWSGETTPRTVEVSTDDGKIWNPAACARAADPFVWTTWSYNWEKPAAGLAKVLVRCEDNAGRKQPEKRDLDRRTYMINHLVPVEFVVK